MRTLHLVSHTHWDREWYLTFQQFRLKLVHLVDNLIEILDRDPNYRFFMLDGQTIVLDDYLAMRPERRGDLERLVQAGRIQIGPWFILPDEFLVSPEAIIRNLLLGRRIANTFGACMAVGYIPDPFGHIGQMPQILRGFGIDSASVMRGLADEPCELTWEAPDGSRVLMAYLRDGYGNASSLNPADPQVFTTAVRAMRDSLAPFSASSHLLLLNGTDHMEPSPETAAAIVASAATQPGLDGDILIHSTLPDYLAGLRSTLDLDKLQVVRGELRSSKRTPLLPGVLSTRMWIKQANQACETVLESWAEPFSAWAEWSEDRSGPTRTNSRAQGILKHTSPILRQAWNLLLENHPHDSICGCGIDQIHAEMRPRFDQAHQIGETITQQSLQLIAGRINTTKSAVRTVESSGQVSSALVVFNACGTMCSDVVSATLELPSGGSGFELVDDQGTPLPVQMDGLGGEEMYNAVMSASEFKSALGILANGIVANLAILDMGLTPQGDTVSVELTLSDKSEPDLAACRRGLDLARTCLADPAVKNFHVIAHSPSTVTLVFAALGIPAFGYRTFWVRPRPTGPKPPVRISPMMGFLMKTAGPLAVRLGESQGGKWALARLRPDPASRPPFVIENELFRVEARRDGTLDVLDKRTRVSYPGLNRFVDGSERGDEYNTCPAAADPLIQPRLKSIRVFHGAVEERLEIALDLSLPASLAPGRGERSRQTVLLPITSTARLFNGLPRIDVITKVKNTARDHRLRVHFPAPFSAASGYFDGHFQVVERKVGLPSFDDGWIEQPRPEAPQRAFTSLSDRHSGLTIANRGLPEAEIVTLPGETSEIAVTLLRCVGWLSRSDLSTRKGHAGPGLETPGAQMLGEWTFEYSIIPHSGGTPQDQGWENGFQQAYAFQTGLKAVPTGLHAGGLPSMGAFIQVTPAEFAVSAVKTSEDERGWLVRGVNLSDRTIQAAIRPWKRFASAERINLAEESLGKLEPDAQGTVSLEVKAHEVVTILFS